MCTRISTSCSTFVAKWFIFIIAVKKTPTSNNVTVTALTEANVIHPLRDRFFTPSRKCRLRVLAFISVSSLNLISNNFSAFNRDYTMTDCIYDICIMRRHNNRCAALINASKNIHNIKSCFNI